MDSVNVNHLEELKQKIEALEKFHQIEILQILSKNLCKLNENKNGIFVNMSFLPSLHLKIILFIKHLEVIVCCFGLVAKGL